MYEILNNVYHEWKLLLQTFISESWFTREWKFQMFSNLPGYNVYVKKNEWKNEILYQIQARTVKIYVERVWRDFGVDHFKTCKA